MKVWTLGEIADLTGGELIKGSAARLVERVAFDSRQAAPASLFVPIIGERVNGHDFIADAASRGAVATFASRNWLQHNPLPAIDVIAVTLPVDALQLWAVRYLESLPAHIVGITGSSGKTTTKEMIASVMQTKYRVLKNEGNLNTEIGLPLTVVGAVPEHEWLILEMAMCSPGEIRLLTEIACPDIAVITNVGEAHIELLGSRENIAIAKAEILEGMACEGIAILNGDDALVLSQAAKAPGQTIYFGVGANPQQEQRLYVTDVKNLGDSLEFVVNWSGRQAKVDFAWPGEHNVYNIAAALATGVAAGIPLEQAITGLSDYAPAGNRLFLRDMNDYTVIDDTYNANPTSMLVALQVLVNYPRASRRVAVLGDMLELGQMAETAHLELGATLAASKVDELVVVGTLARHIADGAIEAGLDSKQVHHFMSNQAAAEFLQTSRIAGQLVLIKGSRGMHMEEIVAALKAGV